MSDASILAPVPATGAPADLVGTSIVLVGAFDPMLVQPAHLASQGLLEEGDFAHLRYDVLAPDVSVVRLPWMQLILEATKLTASTTLENPMAEPVRDFVFGFYATLAVKHVTAVGLNHDTHFAVESEEVWHKIGHLLAPKDTLWRNVLKEPGTRSLSIKGKRDDGLSGEINVKVEPSLRIHPGVYINVNDQLDSSVGTVDSPDYLVDLAGKKWDDSKHRSDQIVAAVKSLA